MQARREPAGNLDRQGLAQRRVRAGISSERTGVQVSTPLLGFKIGLREGVEIHVFHLAFGIDLWRPAIIVPLGPGRIGFADR